LVDSITKGSENFKEQAHHSFPELAWWEEDKPFGQWCNGLW
jgi:hypothetical protein